MVEKKVASYKEHLYEDLKNPQFAASYLSECFKDDKSVFLMALHDVAKAYGVSEVAQSAGLNRESLYKMFKGNPKLDTLDAFLKTIGITMTFQPIKKKDSSS